MKRTITVEGMHCKNCSHAVETAVGGMAGVASAVVDLAAGTLTVEYDEAAVTIEAIAETVEEQGFDAVI